MTITETTDIAQIQTLADQCYMEAYKEIHTVEQNRFSFQEMYSTQSLRRQLAEQGSHFFVVSEDGIDQGYMALCQASDDVWMLDKLYIVPTVHGKGYGRALVQHAIKLIEATTVGPWKLTLNVNRRNTAVQFYQHLGFVIKESWDKEIADGRWVMDGYLMELCKPDH